MSAPALVNHTSRPGFEFASDQSGFDIKVLDAMIDEYWALRESGKIREDIMNDDVLSPFRNKKEVLRPLLNYFLFDGTGSKVSALPADHILGFTNPLKPETWRLYNRSNAIDDMWDNLVFSLRAKKGMPSGYPDNLKSQKMKDAKPSIDLWTKYINHDYRGALHIRSTQ